MADALVQALDDGRFSGGRLQFRQTHDHAEADEEREDERGACDESQKKMKNTPHDRPRVGGTHSSSSACDRLEIGTSYCTRPRRTSSIATRSGFFGICCSLPSSNLTRAPRRNCLARSAATSTNKKRLSIAGTGSAGIMIGSNG